MITISVLFRYTCIVQGMEISYIIHLNEVRRHTSFSSIPFNMFSRINSTYKNMRCHDLEIMVLILHKHHTNTYMQYESLCTNYEIGTNKIYNVFLTYSLDFIPRNKVIATNIITFQKYCNYKILHLN